MSPREAGLLAAALGLLAALLLVPLCRRLALRFNIVDRPGARKMQTMPVPLLGGVAVALAAWAATEATDAFYQGKGTMSLEQHGHILLAGALIFLIGLVDDIFKDKVGPLLKFIGQFLAVAVIFGERYAEVVTGAATAGGVFHLLTTTIWFLTVVNAVNFVDNMNGLCPGLTMISLLVGLFGVAAGFDARSAILAGALGGGMLGFLPYNYPAARVFLGDAGSHLAGFFLALLSLEFTAGFLSADARFFGFDAFIPAMLLLGIPLFDILFSVVRRLSEKRPLFYGDARHLSHRLVGAGLDPASAVMLLWGVHLIVAAAGVVALGQGALERYATFALVLLFLGLLSGVLVRVERLRQERLNGGRQEAR